MEVVRDLSISRSEVLPVLEQSSSIEGSSSISLNLSKLSDIVVPDMDSRMTLNTISAVIEEETIQTDPLDVEVPLILSPPSYTKKNFKKLLEEAITEGNWTTFRSLVPTSKSRTTASKIFYHLLVAGAKGKISLTQEEPYGEIYISRFEAF
ncbi:uncharacterized protein LOC126815742 [Patella vulgata]|uniref:uncharacterized protein LOC126815742 n=1 Tax=Patella vulgata TaxID=6465 RepID=UPI00217FCC27|nr:uncharacterized protein LOC126815742 [Patella vulgata]